LRIAYMPTAMTVSVIYIPPFGLTQRLIVVEEIEVSVSAYSTTGLVAEHWIPEVNVFIAARF